MTIATGPGGEGIIAMGSVQGDVPCRKCGYNLRALPLAGRCPECGTSIGVSVNGDLLRYSDPQFVETLRRGVNLILWGILIGIIGVIIAVFALKAGLRSLSQLLILAASVPSLIGGWWITTPDPSGIGEDRYGTARHIIRFSLAAGLVFSLLNFAMNAALPGQSMLIQIISFLAQIIAVIALSAQLYYLHKLALRIPDVPLSERARFLMWAIGICDGTDILLGRLAAFLGTPIAGPRARANPISMGLGCFTGLAGLAIIVFGVMYLFMLFRFNRSFKEQAALARESWSSTAAGAPAPDPPGL